MPFCSASLLTLQKTQFLVNGSLQTEFCSVAYVTNCDGLTPLRSRPQMSLGKGIKTLQGDAPQQTPGIACI